MIQLVYNEVKDLSKTQTKVLTKVSAMEEHLRTINSRLDTVEVDVNLNKRKLYMAQGGLGVLSLVVTIFVISSYLM